MTIVVNIEETCRENFIKKIWSDILILNTLVSVRILCLTLPFSPVFLFFFLLMFFFFMLPLHHVDLSEGVSIQWF